MADIIAQYIQMSGASSGEDFIFTSSLIYKESEASELSVCSAD